MDELKSTLILADDHPLFMKGLIASLEEEFLIIAIATNGKELLELLKRHQPDAIVIDLQMPYMDRWTAAKEITTHYPKIKLIILSAFYDNKIECQLKQFGIKGYLTKDIESDLLICQIKLILDGEIGYCEPKKNRHFLNRPLSAILINDHKLSTRELEVVSLIKNGLTSTEISKKLFISINTVEAHRKHIFKKLNIRNVQGLIEFAYTNSL